MGTNEARWLWSLESGRILLFHDTLFVTDTSRRFIRTLQVHDRVVGQPNSERLPAPTRWRPLCGGGQHPQRQTCEEESLGQEGAAQRVCPLYLWLARGHSPCAVGRLPRAVGLPRGQAEGESRLSIGEGSLAGDAAGCGVAHLG